jgi:uncharacterized lipoprotein YajG
MRKIAVLFAFILAGVFMLAGCGPKQETAASAPTQTASVKRYSLHGKVLSVNTTDKTAKIDADEVPGWMSKMTMDYPVKDTAELAKMVPDKDIEATVFVEGDNFWLGEVKEAPAAPEKK